MQQQTTTPTEPVMPEGLGGELILPGSAYARDRRPWLAARRSGLGASDTAAILGLNDWRTPLEVWQEKTSTADVVDTSPSIAAEMGGRNEAHIARMVSRDNPEIGKIAPTPGLLRHPDHPWMLATLDRVLVARRVTPLRALSLLEIKTTSRWNYKAHWLEGWPPTSVLVQVQQQLAVTGLPFAWVACWFDHQQQPSLVKVDRNDAVIATMIDAAEAWWETHVVGGVRPAPVRADLAGLGRLWPGDPDLKPIIADDALLDAAGRLAAAKTAIKAHEEVRDQAEFEIKTRMKEHTHLIGDDRSVLVTWKPGTTTRLQGKALAAAHPDLVREFQKTTPTRTFLVKEIDT